MQPDEAFAAALIEIKNAHQKTEELISELFEKSLDVPTLSDLRRLKHALVMEKIYVIQAEMNLLEDKVRISSDNLHRGEYIH